VKTKVLLRESLNSLEFTHVLDGVSVIICSHNGATRLPATLAHLKVQKPPMVPWEVLLIDNASTDATAAVARSCWQNGPVPLHVIEEPRLGLRYARERGLAEANYAFLGFVDDDNWVANDWVCTAYEVMSSDASLGALGGILTPAHEVPLPDWFENLHSSYAILTDRDFKQIREPFLYLTGAGLCLRKEAWEELIQNGFSLNLTDRLGKRLLAGGDTELTMLLRLNGWKLQIDPRLRLQHFMPGHRLRWSYARRLLRDHSESWVLLDAYSERSLSSPPGFRRWLSERWWYQFGSSLSSIASQPRLLMVALWSSGDGRKDIIKMEQLFGRALGFLRHNKRYGELRREVRQAFYKRSLGYSQDRRKSQASEGEATG
jgi:glycosyltransferase involved in cell wall biosynthesis